eukprot:gnl/TRDRNA2_/TRDRNA2_158746_c3_seq1.p1 gnl/TRDRNA2_/TRDRNA2_158746_c3~~gnl/TRDRNA2_/TRDRNA2_158746_c3_seq1.p1  ORF type:complete len:226 (+),score=25.12 gnl/TRDRNA2_/TRDRNA2_158746_c3_seq1:35-712(+)
MQSCVLMRLSSPLIAFALMVAGTCAAAVSDEAQEASEDAFNVYSTIGVVSALLLSLVVSSGGTTIDLTSVCPHCENDAKDLANGECVNVWGTCEGSLTATSALQVAFYISGVFCVTSVLTSISTLINYMKIPRAQSCKYRESMARLSKIPGSCMAMGIISCSVGFILQSSILLAQPLFFICASVFTVCLVTYLINEAFGNYYVRKLNSEAEAQERLALLGSSASQ